MNEITEPDTHDFPDYAKKSEFYQDVEVSEDQLKETNFKCDTRILYPTHPEQYTKLYHIDKGTTFNQHKLSGNHDACLRSDERRFSVKNQAKKGLPPRCIVPDVFIEKYISDTYIDICGNYYRAVTYWDYYQGDEVMPHGVPLGKVLSTVPGKEDQTISIRGRRSTQPMYNKISQTHGVAVSQFKILAELLSGDMQQINQLRREALAGDFILEADKLTFRRVKW